MSELSIVILNYKTKELTMKCLESVFSNPPSVSFDVWLVDNNSEDNILVEAKKRFSNIHTVQSPENGGFAKGNNLALKKANSRFLMLLNSDTEVTKGVFAKILNFMEKNNLGIASCKIVSPDGTFQQNGGALPYLWPIFIWLSGIDDIFSFLQKKLPSYQFKSELQFKNNKSLGWVGGTAMMIRKEVIEKIGLLDENFFMYGEDVEFCLRAKKAGFEIGWTDEGEILHVGGASSVDPYYRQWLGEFKGLEYIYSKFFNLYDRFLLKLLLYKFITLRIIAFALLGKINYSKTYGQILTKI